MQAIAAVPVFSDEIVATVQDRIESLSKSRAFSSVAYKLDFRAKIATFRSLAKLCRELGISKKSFPPRLAARVATKTFVSEAIKEKQRERARGTTSLTADVADPIDAFSRVEDRLFAGAVIAHLVGQGEALDHSIAFFLTTGCGLSSREVAKALTRLLGKPYSAAGIRQWACRGTFRRLARCLASASGLWSLPVPQLLGSEASDADPGTTVVHLPSSHAAAAPEKDGPIVSHSRQEHLGAKTMTNHKDQ